MVLREKVSTERGLAQKEQTPDAELSREELGLW